MERFFEDFRTKDTLVFVDPAMADNGRMYAGFAPAFADSMARLCARADIIVPNMSEACFMLHRDYMDHGYSEEDVRSLLRQLADIGAGDIPKIIAYNKIDLLEEDRIRISSADDYVKISAREGTGMETLLEKTAAALFPDRQETEVLIPYDKGSITSYLCEKCSVLEMDYRDNGTYLRVMLDGPDRRRLESYILQQKGRQTWQNT